MKRDPGFATEGKCGVRIAELLEVALDKEVYLVAGDRHEVTELGRKKLGGR
jgi:hypothetical protein